MKINALPFRHTGESHITTESKQPVWSLMGMRERPMRNSINGPLEATKYRS